MINKNFTYLWSGKIVSQLGDKFYAIALAWWFSLSTLVSNISLPVAYGLFGLLLNLSSILVLMAACGLGLIVLCLYLFCLVSNLQTNE